MKKQICKIKQSTKTNLGPIRPLSTLLTCSKDSYYNGLFKENKRNIKTVWKTVEELITIKQRNDLPLTTLQIGKKKKMKLILKK